MTLQVTLVTLLALASMSEPPDLAEEAKESASAGIDWFRSAGLAESSGSNRTPRLTLLGGLPTGFLQMPIGFEDEEPCSLAPAADDLEGLILAVGSHNPYLDWRRGGDPGGLGYCKLFSQMQVLDLGSTSICVNFQALTPAGLEAGGRASGPTVLTPSLAWFHDLGEGVAVQGFVGRHVRANSQWNESLDRGVHYGLAWQWPLLWDESEQGLFFFFQALGSHRYDYDPTYRTRNVELIPGLHWRLNPDCWMSLGASRFGLFTCSWQY